MDSKTNYVVSDNGTEREATPEEIIAIEENKRMFEEDLAKMAKREADKAAAVEKFAAIGLTADELKALLG